MTRSITHSLWVRQTAYTVLVVALVAIAITGSQTVSSYHDERDRLQEFGNHLIDSFYDAAARAAFHIDRLQAESVIEGLMKFEQLQYISITTDLDTLLARRTRNTNTESVDALATWLFADISVFKRELVIDRSQFVTNRQKSQDDGLVSVGDLEIRVDPTVVGHSFVEGIRARAFVLLVEFLLLGTALAYIFYLTTTKPLVNVAEQLRHIDPHGSKADRLNHIKSHQNDELGLVVDRINDLLQKIEEQQVDLVHREKIAALGSMLAEVAHELNNPLAVVTAQAELLAETATDDKTRERAEKILRPAKRCANIVRKFLSLARQRKIEKRALDVRGLIDESIEMLGYQLAKRNISIQIDIDPHIARIWGDNAQLGQVIINVLVNAQQALGASDENREVSIEARSSKSSDTVVISITDNGPGIPANILPRVFDHFFTTKPEGRGTGLGLAFCKSVVEAHGGTIVARPIKPHGTTIVIELPSTTKAAEGEAGHTHSYETHGSLRVLVVDDEKALANSIAEVLSYYGHSPTTTYSAAQAMTRLQASAFDVILADVHMPGTDGMAFYRDVLAIDKTLAEKFVFITGDALDPRLLEFFEKKRRPVINKPFELKELIAIVEKAMLTQKNNESLREESGASANAG